MSIFQLGSFYQETGLLNTSYSWQDTDLSFQRLSGKSGRGLSMHESGLLYVLSSVYAVTQCQRMGPITTANTPSSQ